MLRRRLDAAGLSSLATEAARALVMGDVPFPPAVEDVLADLIALPVSPRAYQTAIDLAAIVSQVEGTLRREGVPLEQARALAREAAAEMARRRRGRIAAPTRLRIGDDREAEAELEREAEDEAARAAERSKAR